LLGLAFQIADDVLDYLGSVGEDRQPSARDIAEGFATLPLMLAREDPDTASKLDRVLSGGRKLKRARGEKVVELVRGSHAPQQAIDRAREYASAARMQLDAIAPGEARDALAALTDYVVIRSYNCQRVPGGYGA